MVSWFLIFVMSLVFLYLFIKLESQEISLMLDICFSMKFIFLMSVTFFMDSSSALLGFVVLFISSFVMIFSGFYMSHETYISRFIGLVVLFVFSMSMLIFFPSFLMLMIGWDGLGVVSFLLVIYYMNKESLSAGMITAIVNRLGDVFFILSLGVFSSFLSYEVFSMWIFDLGLLVSLMVVLGSMTKSAQVPFSAWLPAAMAAPTPVSTLVHSSTLVTAGVYVLFRFSNLIEMELFIFLLFISLMTTVMSGLSAIFEVDMKKVIALSTLSQLGVMMLSISLGMKMVALFHLAVHAFFKALMFMCMGSLIFYSGGVQDGRMLGDSLGKVPFIGMWLLICNMSLMGLPFMSGFYSKDLILEFGMSNNFSGFGLFVFLVSVVLTVFYSIRMMLMLLVSDSVYPLEAFFSLDFFLFFSTLGLGFGAVWGGYFFQVLCKKFNKFIFVSYYEKLLILMSIVFFLFFMMFLYFKEHCFNMSSSWMNNFLGKMLFLPFLSGNLMSSFFLKESLKLVFNLEKGWLEGYVWGKGMKNVFMSASYSIHGFQGKALGLSILFGFLICLFLI